MRADDLILTVRPAPRIEWLPGVPPEVRQAVEPILEVWLPRLAPSWLHRVVVKWDHWGDAAAARCHSDPEYRSMRLTICPQWVTDTEDRERHLVHELVHLPFQSVLDAFDAATAKLDDAVRDAYAEQMRLAVEGAACDLTDVLQRQYEESVDNRAVFGSWEPAS